MHSNLCTGIFIADPSNYTKGRNGYSICKLTPHMMAGILSGEQCAKNVFQNPSKNASANYCIGNEGDLVCNVEEENRPWTSSNRINDYQAISVEVSNCEVGGQWRVSDKAWNTLVNLAVDVCRRYNFRLYYDGTPNGSLTTHNMFTNTDCPGSYLLSKMNELANTVNTILDGGTPQPQPTPTPQPFTGDDKIRSIQNWLNNNYDTNITEDGLYGSQTKKALVKGLQTELNIQFGVELVVDGIFGNQTKAACRNVKQGAEGNITKIIQSMLYCKKYYLGIDGIFGNETTNVVKNYQADNKLSADGIVGKNTFESLFR